MELLRLILGDATFIQWIYALALAFLGFMLLKLITFERRTEKTTSFNPYYWWKDNRVEFFIGIIIFYVLMRFHPEVTGLLSDKFSFPLIDNRYLFVFVCGLCFQLILKKARSYFKIRTKQYPSGQLRAEHVGSRPDDR